MDVDKIENMLSQLIRMVGNIQSEQQEMKQELQGIKQELGSETRIGVKQDSTRDAR